MAAVVLHDARQPLNLSYLVVNDCFVRIADLSPDYGECRFAALLAETTDVSLAYASTLSARGIVADLRLEAQPPLSPGKSCHAHVLGGAEG